MLEELLSIFRGVNQPLSAMGKSFSAMLNLALENALAAGAVYFDRQGTAEERSEIYEKDIRINKLERDIRKRVVAHLALRENYTNMPYCLLLVTLAKDVERLGDYAKNVVEVRDLRPDDLPDDEIVKELREIRREVEESFKEASRVLDSHDREGALQHIHAGRDIAHRCDALVTKIARSDYDACTATAIVLGTRYYKRIGGHVLNLLTSVVMPLHKVDYFDEDSLKDAGPSS